MTKRSYQPCLCLRHILFFFLFAAGQLPGQIPEYTISFLEKPVESTNRGLAGAINDRGQVVGTWGDAAGRQQVYLWESESSYLQLSFDPKFPLNFSGGINNEGAVAGTLQGFELDRGVRLTTPVVWRDFDQVKLPALPAAIVNAAWTRDINNNHQVVGTSFAERVTHAVWWDENGFVSDIGVPDGFASSEGLAISESGVVLGAGRASYVKPFLWSAETGFEVIEEDKPIWIVPTAMNERQQVVGWMNNRDRAFVWDRELGLTEIPDFPGGRESIEALAISEDGLVIGEGYRGNTRTPFIWQREAGLTELQSRVVDLPAGWFLTDVGGFNGRGQMSARAFFQDEDLNRDSALVVLTPLESDAPKGDFNHDQQLTAEDMDLLSQEIRSSGRDLRFDVNGDLLLNESDRLGWLELAGALLGDANLDGRVGFPDFLILSGGFGLAGGWGDGDFDGSGDVQFADFLIQSTNFGESILLAVPEPSAAKLFFCGFLAILLVRLSSRAGSASNGGSGYDCCSHESNIAAG